MKVKYYLTGATSLIMLLVVLFGQQCSRVDLEKLQFIDLFSITPDSFRLNPPSKESFYRRYILMVDMSNSMVQGPGATDVAEFGYWSTEPQCGYDPNKDYPPSPQFDGFDCRIDVNLQFKSLTENRKFIYDQKDIINQNNFMQYYSPYNTPFTTFIGTDHEANRLNILQGWMDTLFDSSTLPMLQQTQIMLIPVTGGDAQKAMLENMRVLHRQILLEEGMSKEAVDSILKNRISFIALAIKYEGTGGHFTETADQGKERINRLVKSLRDTHENDKAKLSLPPKVVIDPATLKMGTTNPVPMMPEIYKEISDNMRELGSVLSKTNYNFVHLTDGILSPSIDSPTMRLSSMYAPCVVSDPLYDAAACSLITSAIIPTWGDPKSANVDEMGLYLTMIKGLPNYFGGGDVDVDFIEVNKERTRSLYEAASIMFAKLKTFMMKYNQSFGEFEIDKDGKTNYTLAMSDIGNISYGVQDIFIYNPNVRINQFGKLIVDSDGDGLEDSLDPNPLKARSMNGKCLDSIMSVSVYAGRCSVAIGKNCNAELDSDGDSLNECEEMALGTSAFDFDTDGDGMPDSLEWINGFNPMRSDLELDTNGDGFMNLQSFTRGINPAVNLLSYKGPMVTYSRDKKGRESLSDPLFGRVWIDLYEVVVKSFLVSVTKSAQPSEKLYSLRKGQSVNLESEIGIDKQLIGANEDSARNQIVVLVRMNNKVEPQKKFYWKILKSTVPVTDNIRTGTIDLSRLEDVTALDKGR